MATGRVADYAPQIPEVWAGDLYAEAENLTFWNRFMGEPGSAMPIVRRDELEGGPGNQINIDIVMALAGAGVAGDTSSLEGNEEKLKFRQTAVTVRQIRNGVRWTELSELEISHNMRTTALGQLRNWLAETIDLDLFAEFTGNTKRDLTTGTTIPTSGIYAAGSATSRATVADGNGTGRLQLVDLVQLKAYARATLKIQPIRLQDGQEIFGFVANPYAIMQLKRDDTTWAQAQREANVRGADNPIFTGAAGMYDGVVIYENSNVPRSTNGTVQVADNIFFGAQALSFGYLSLPTWREQLFDYENEAGIATSVVKGEKLNTFDLTAAGGAADSAKTAIGSVVVYTSAVAPTQP